MAIDKTEVPSALVNTLQKFGGSARCELRDRPHAFVLLEKGGVFIRSLFGVYGNRDGKRSNCPHCDGSGLLRRQKSWPWNRQTDSNNPCWFCEGLGVLPIYGLHGFLLGRGTAVCKAVDLRAPLNSPINLQLCLGKYPGTQCKLRSFRPLQKMSELLYDFSKSPSWLIDAADELAATSPAVKSRNCDQARDLNGCDVGDASGNVERAARKYSLLSLLFPSELPGHYDQDLARKPFMKVGMSKLIAGPSQSNITKGKTTTGVEEEGMPSYKVHTKRADVAGNVNAIPSMMTSNSSYADKSKVPRHSQGEETKRNLRRHSSNSRRTRFAGQNRIRVEAEKEAVAQALRKQRLKQARSDQSTSTTQNDDSGPSWSTSSDWKELSQKWIAEETALMRQSARSDLPPSDTQPALNLAFINLLLCTKLVDKLLFIPKFVKQLKH